ncbi:YetF domain-containing protein [Kribbella sp. CA-293567]|uniref:YetF domain-containing protein n=1 Tax=Kribbella sp. CA-293567 TaxID=3002436 RepID=UPI0022DD0D1E|nr:YetF domain-containing protein [Kribbella sp. CA-293567]WBQ03395.1 DUF421 domain-containing protein [Kribbella sp. CA-293567]
MRIALVGATAYVTLVVVLRLAGKRTLSKLNAFDFVVTVALGSTLATILLSEDVSFVEGASALMLLALLQFALSWTVTHLPTSRGVVNAAGSVVLLDGELLEDVMARERITPGQVRQAVRGAGLGSLSGAGAVVLETDGSLNVVQRAKMSDRSALTGLIPRTDGATERSTGEVLRSHLHHRAAGRLTADLEENYHPDVVLLSDRGMHRGHDGVRRLADVLHRYHGNDEWTGTHLEIENEFGFLRWSAHHGPYGAESFVVTDGKIVIHTVHSGRQVAQP